MLRIQTLLKDETMNGFDKDFNPNKFLFEKDCFLKEYNFGTDGLFIPAGNLINQHCAAYNINQRMILTTLQRECSMISIKIADEALKKKNDAGLPIMDWCCCCGLPDNLQPNLRYQGFTNQIAGACAKYRRWYDLFKAEVLKELAPPDKEKVCIPENAITFSLLCYTPHIEALHSTEKIYFNFF